MLDPTRVKGGSHIGFLSKLLGGGATAARSAAVTPLNHSLPDDEWLAESRRVFEATLGERYGSPESMAGPGEEHYGHQNFGVAMFFYGKSIDMLQTAYGFFGMGDRQPSPADAWIVDGYVRSIGASLAMHPQAPVGDSAATTLGLLRDIAGECQRVGVSHQLYSDAAEQVALEARDHLTG